jgi:hypothetical protein
MTVHARSDIASVTLSIAHGGCGKTHHRPADDGNPVAVWSLDCPACEDHLRNDPLWAASIAEIPETHDEEVRRTEVEKRGAKSRDNLIAIALAKAVGMDADADLLAQIMGVPVAAKKATVDCPNGHANPLDQKFCGECGQPVNDPFFIGEVTPGPAASVSAGVAEAAAGTTQDRGSFARYALPSNTQMRRMKGGELAALAKNAGLDAEGTRQEVLDRLLAANKAAGTV